MRHRSVVGGGKEAGGGVVLMKICAQKTIAIINKFIVLLKNVSILNIPVEAGD